MSVVGVLLAALAIALIITGIASVIGRLGENLADSEHDGILKRHGARLLGVILIGLGAAIGAITIPMIVQAAAPPPVPPCAYSYSC